MKLTNRPSTIGELEIVSTANEELDKQDAMIAALLALLTEGIGSPVETGPAFATDLEIAADLIEGKFPTRANALRAKADAIRAAIALVGGHITMAEFEQVATDRKD